MKAEFILIPGRSGRQGITLNEGKYTAGYQDETSTLRMNPDDMQSLQIAVGDRVRMWNDIGEVVVPVIDAKDECPPGLVFICYGDKSSQLMGGETHGSGMPDSKGLDVFIAPENDPAEETVAPAESEPSEQAAPSADEVPRKSSSDGDAVSASVVVEDPVPAGAMELQPVREQPRDTSASAATSHAAETRPPNLQSNGSSFSSESFRSSRFNSEQGSASGFQVALVVISFLGLLLYAILQL